jgi:hypothetical protein
MNEAFAIQQERVMKLRRNLKFVDLVGCEPDAQAIVDAITALQFEPDIVFIDQLEYITTETDDGTGMLGRAEAPAQTLAEQLAPLNVQTWVLHQVRDDPQWTFTLNDVSGGERVTSRFACVIGIGRKSLQEHQLRIFSLTPGMHFETIFDVDFKHMRFQPSR